MGRVAERVGAVNTNARCQVLRTAAVPAVAPSGGAAGGPQERLSFECLEGELHAEAHVAHGFDEDGTGDARRSRPKRLGLAAQRIDV